MKTDSIKTFTMDEMPELVNMLEESIIPIINKTTNTLKYRHWRIRLMWKNIFNMYSKFDNAYTENIYHMFKSAISYHIENMGEEDTVNFINNIIKTMKEV